MTPGEEVRSFYRRQGQVAEQERIVKAASNRLCFDYLEKKSCDHQACYALAELIDAVKGYK